MLTILANMDALYDNLAPFKADLAERGVEASAAAVGCSLRKKPRIVPSVRSSTVFMLLRDS